ncbi:MAG: DUF3592 domain-containing protein [Terracidiphilus sp.]|jgi:hypothetical protein
MLIEIWEHLRGYDKWVETDAKIESSEPTYYKFKGHDYSHSDDVIVWTDSTGEKHRAPFTVHVDSPLFQLVQDSTTRVRYNPADPEEYYFRELLQTRVRKVLSTAGVAALLIAALVFFGWLRTLDSSK